MAKRKRSTSGRHAKRADRPARNASGKWKKGCPSPNPRGRPKKTQPTAPNHPATQALDQPVRVSINGQAKKISAREAAALKLAEAAVKGDQKALRELRKWEEDSQKLQAGEVALAAHYPLEADDLRTLENVCARIRAASNKPNGKARK